MRLFLLALDGLDPILVEKWKEGLKDLLQARYGPYQSSEEKLTPYLWASIITGLPPDQALPAVHSVVPVNPILRWVKRNLKFLRGKGLGKLVKRRWVDKRDLGGTPIFDTFKSIVIDFPAYNWYMDFEICTKYPYSKVIGDEERSHILFSTVCRHDDYKIRKCISILESIVDLDWEIMAVWIHQTDMVNHLYWKDKKKMLKTYLRANSYARMIKDHLPEDCVLVIASDHGSFEGVHRDKGFVSCSIDVELPKTLTDFYPFFLSILNRDI